MAGVAGRQGPGIGDQALPFRKSLIQHEREQLIALGCERVLPPIRHIGLRRVADATDARVPEGLARGSLVSHQILAVAD
jgi:hypothetical protein